MMGKGKMWLGLLPAFGLVLACGSDRQFVRAGDEDGEGGDNGTGASGGTKSSGGTSGGGTSGNGGTKSSGGTSGAGQTGKSGAGGTSGDGGDGGDAGSPGEPVACEEGQFRSEEGDCTEWTKCEAGEYVSGEGSETSDRECSTCSQGFTTGENATACTAWKQCNWQAGGYAKNGTPTSDAECGSPSAYRQIGTDQLDNAYGVAVDANGNVYVTGYTQGALAGPNTSSYDVFLRKYDPNGNVLWTDQFTSISAVDPSYYSNEIAYGVAVDGSGNAYIAGYTDGSLQGPNQGSNDGFVRKYTPDGKVAWTRQFGSDANDVVWAIAVDAAGNSYLAGYTLGVIDTASFGNYDAFLRKYDTNGNHAWTKQWGGSQSNNWDEANAVTVDSNGDVYVAGVTSGVLSGMASNGGRDVFVRKFNNIGGTLATTQFGTSADDSVYAIAVSGGSLYVTGVTSGDLGGTNQGSGDVYVKKFNSSNLGSPWTKLFGTSSLDYARGMAVDANGNVYVGGYTGGNLAGSKGSSDGFVRVFNSGGDVLNTYQFGSPQSDLVYGVAVDSSNRVYVAGTTLGSLQGAAAGLDDAFVMQLLP